MERIEVGELEIGYQRAGHGPAVVLLHGYVGDGTSTWRPHLEGLADEFTVIAWDAPGAGTSADPATSLGMAGYVDCLAGFVAALGLRRPHLVGLSFGGALAIATAARHPGIARSLVVASGYAGWRGSLPADVAERRLVQAMTLSQLSGDELVDALLPTMFATEPAADDVHRFASSVRTFHPVGLRAMAEASVEDLRGLLPSVAVPTLLIYGNRDIRAPAAVADHLHAAIPHSELTVLRGAGHVCNLEVPDTFNATLREWLNRRRSD